MYRLLSVLHLIIQRSYVRDVVLIILKQPSDARQSPQVHTWFDNVVSLIIIESLKLENIVLSYRC